MLTAISLENFKAFAGRQTIPIRPITLVFGANSSGKSSLLHSLLLTNHALAHGNLDVHQPRLAGQSVDLGGFLEYVHGHQPDRRCSFGFSLHHAASKPVPLFAQFGRAGLTFEIGLLDPKHSGGPRAGCVGLISFSLTIEDRLLLRATRNADEAAGSLTIDSLEISHPVFKPFFERALAQRTPESLDPTRYEPAAGDLPADAMTLRESQPGGAALLDKIQRLQEQLANQRNETDRDFRKEPENDLTSWCEVGAKGIPLAPGNLVPISVRPKGARERFHDLCEKDDLWCQLKRESNVTFLEMVAADFCFCIEDLLDWANDEFSRHLESLAYLGPLRSYPPRHLVGMHDQDPNWFSGGGHAWDTLRRDPAVLAQVNRWLGSPDFCRVRYELRLRNLTDLNRVSDAVRQRIADRLRQSDPSSEAGVNATLDALLVDLADDPAASALGEIRLLDRHSQTEVSHRDVGVGVSQVLPVLVHAFACRNQLVLIEQPEIHLHPALQAELGDVLLQSALGENRNTFVLETHSEHLILRIMRRMRETRLGRLPTGCPPVRPEDVSVVFVEPTDTSETGQHRTLAREMPLNSRGELVKSWPGGFFEEGYRELFA